ncbi:30S ribosomal protein S4 [Candidatus Wolfebacteria bacterium]|nr:30S ribosomal protein S4 [Candidatus Wolfebacteria bacterium]
MIGAKEKKERALGTKLFLKAYRSATPKSAMVRKPYRPGAHGKSRRRALSEFGQQLLEKQKIMVSYGLREAQMRKMFKEALGKKEAVSDAIVNLLERRLDNVVYRLGFAPSRIMARQFVSHGHILVNGRKVTIPSYRVKIGDIVVVKPASLLRLIFKDLAANIKKYEVPNWLNVDKEKLEGKIKSLPRDIEIPFDISLVVDYYSR